MAEFSFQEADQQIRSAWLVETGRNRRSMVIGWYGYRVKAANEFQKHGYADEAAYRDAVGVSRAVWGRMVRVAGLLEKLDMQQFTAMTAENAEQLGSLSEEKRYDMVWLRRAETLEAETFRRFVLAELAGAAGVPVPEMRVRFGMPLFENQRRVIKEGIAEFQKENGIKDEGTALEWMVMEISGRRTFAQFVREQIKVLRAALRDGQEAKAVLGLHVVALADMLENLRSEKGT